LSVLEARSLACSRGDSRLFRDISFTVGAGEWIAVRGANGSGKTTLLRCVAGLTRPDSGEVLWNAAPVHANIHSFHGSLLYAGHAPGLKDELSATENLRDALALRDALLPDAALHEALGSVGLAKVRRLPSQRLSAGQRRRIGIARLSLDPAALWILDEPLTALDSEGETLFAGLLERHLQRGGSALIATHHPIAGAAPREVRLTQ
jgi:heme exporter protein A